MSRLPSRVGPTGRPLPLSGKKYLLVAFIGLAVACAAVTGQSLWIDEGTSAFKAIQPNLHEWARALRADGSSNLQLPLHFIYLWTWEKFFGPSEIALRAANIPLFVIATLALFWGFAGRPRRQILLIALLSVNAFLWYYLSEARPYLLVFTGSCICLASLARSNDWSSHMDESSHFFPVFCAGIVVLAASTLIAVPWVAGFIGGMIIILRWSQFLRMLRQHWLSGVLSLGALLCLGLYFLWTISLGAHATNIGGTGVRNLLFAIYEQLGLSGLGPGRNELRIEGAKAVKAYWFPLALGVLGLAAPCAFGFAKIFRRKKAFALTLVVIVLPVLSVLLAGHFTQSRLLGRHLTPLLVFILLGLAFGLESLLQSEKLLRWLAVVFFFALQGLSAVQMRFAPRHARDDYRDAATLALKSAQAGSSVWWAADADTGAYYHVPLGQKESGITYVMNPRASELVSYPNPNLIILSKRDVYDAHGALDEYIKSRSFKRTDRLQAFEIFQR